MVSLALGNPGCASTSLGCCLLPGHQYSFSFSSFVRYVSSGGLVKIKLKLPTLTPVQLIRGMAREYCRYWPEPTCPPIHPTYIRTIIELRRRTPVASDLLSRPNGPAVRTPAMRRSVWCILSLSHFRRLHTICLLPAHLATAARVGAAAGGFPYGGIHLAPGPVHADNCRTARWRPGAPPQRRTAFRRQRVG